MSVVVRILRAIVRRFTSIWDDTDFLDDDKDEDSDFELVGAEIIYHPPTATPVTDEPLDAIAVSRFTELPRISTDYSRA